MTSNSFDCILVGLCHRIQWHGRTPRGEEVKEEEELLSVDLSSFILTYCRSMVDTLASV